MKAAPQVMAKAIRMCLQGTVRLPGDIFMLEQHHKTPLTPRYPAYCHLYSYVPWHLY